MDYTLTVSSQGQVVIPVKVRKALKLKPGSKVTLTVDTAHPIPKATLRPDPHSWVKLVAGTSKGLWGDVDEYIRKERDSWDRT